jgi:hypothetical protein
MMARALDALVMLVGGFIIGWHLVPGPEPGGAGPPIVARMPDSPSSPPSSSRAGEAPAAAGQDCARRKAQAAGRSAAGETRHVLIGVVDDSRILPLAFRDLVH